MQSYKKSKNISFIRTPLKVDSDAESYNVIDEALKALSCDSESAKRSDALDILKDFARSAE